MSISQKQMTSTIYCDDVLSQPRCRDRIGQIVKDAKGRIVYIIDLADLQIKETEQVTPRSEWLLVWILWSDFLGGHAAISDHDDPQAWPMLKAGHRSLQVVACCWIVFDQYREKRIRIYYSGSRYNDKNRRNNSASDSRPNS